MGLQKTKDFSHYDTLHLREMVLIQDTMNRLFQEIGRDCQNSKEKLLMAKKRSD